MARNKRQPLTSSHLNGFNKKDTVYLTLKNRYKIVHIYDCTIIYYTNKAA